MTNQTMTEQRTVYYERTYKNTTPCRVMAALRRTKALGDYRVDIERAESTVEAADSDARLHSRQSTRSFVVCTTRNITRTFEVAADAHDITCRIVETVTDDAKRDFGGTRTDYEAAIARREAAQAERDRIGAQPVTPDMTEAEVAARNNAFSKAQEAFMQACKDEAAAMSAALEAEREAEREPCMDARYSDAYSIDIRGSIGNTERTFAFAALLDGISEDEALDTLEQARNMLHGKAWMMQEA